MKYFASIALLIAFTGMAVFGAFLIEHSMTHHGDCAASLILGTLCPANFNNLFSHHIAALQSFLASLPSSPIAALMLLLLLTYAAFLAGFGELGFPPQQQFAYSQNCGDRRGFRNYSLLRWLARFEHSPSA